MSFVQKTPALRLVNSSGGVIAGPQILYQPNAQGIFCNVTCQYNEEFVYASMNLAYQHIRKVAGYRAVVTIDFLPALAANASGFANVYQYMIGGMNGEGYAALQFNLFATTCNVWRGMFPNPSWAPKPAGGKDLNGYELSVTLEARDLIAAPQDWSSGSW